MDVVGGIAGGLGLVVSLVVVAWLAKVAAHRLLGAPVGGLRAFVVGLVFCFAASPIANALVVPAALVDGETGEVLVSFGVGGLLVALAFAWAFVLAVALLVLAELIAPTGTVPDPLTWLRGQLARRRRTRRYLRVTAIFARHGLRSLLRQDPRGMSAGEVGRALVGALNASGVTFVKLGQVLSTRAEVVPPAMAAELARLQTDAAPVPWEEIDRVLTDELGDRRARLDVDPAPLAAASLAQVHAAVLRPAATVASVTPDDDAAADNAPSPPPSDPPADPSPNGTTPADRTDVVVKVRRPGAPETVRVDVDIVRRLAAATERRAAWARDMRLGALADGFGDALLEELDYGREVANTLLLAGAVGSDVDVPAIHQDLCTPGVIVMERIDGVTLGRAADALTALETASPGARDALARTLLTSVLRQVLVVGVFHADLHPGNVVLRENGRLALLDLGSVGVLDSQLRELLLGLLAAFDAQDNEAAATLLMQLVPPSDIDGYALRRDLGAAMTVVAGPGGLGPVGMARLFEVFRTHRLALPPHVAAALRTFASLQGCLEILAPGADLVALVRTCTREVAKEVLHPESLAATATSRAFATLAVVGRLPGRVDAIVQQVATGELAGSRRLRTELSTWGDRVLSDVVSALVAGVLVIAGVMLLGVDGAPMMTRTVPWTWFLAASVGLGGFALILRVLFRQFARR